MDIQTLLSKAIERKASDLHLIVDYPPILRVNGVLSPLKDFSLLTEGEIQSLLFSILTPEQKELFLGNREIDFSVSFASTRFRVNAYHQRGNMAAAIRVIPFKIPSFEELKLPKICQTIVNLQQGFVLVVGPTGHGKSTTIASIINEINLRYAKHIVTIEDPIEYVFGKGKGLISQRELHVDTHSWEIALRSVLREDPDVVFIGEMRDPETISSALTIAETGHLVFSTLHTNSASQTVDRIIDAFPENQQAQARMQLSAVLEVVISQRLVPTIDDKRVPATEILVGTPAVKTAIREGKTHLLDNIIQTSAEMGMRTLESDLIRLVKEGEISLETAQRFALKPEEVIRLFREIRH